jgi:formate-dependent nitrite reductase membrane component NrfD
VAVLFALTGLMAWDDPVTRYVAPLLALVFLGITGVLLIWDLKHPFRFWLIFTRHQWRSWLVRGSFIIGAFGAAASASLVVGFFDLLTTQQVIGVIGAVTGLATACYTAYLFAQAKARDLWQSPLLPAHLAVQAVLAGAASLLPFALAMAPQSSVHALEVVLAVSAAAHLLLVWTETTLPHVTAHARLAGHEMTRGRFATFFRVGLVGVLVSVAAPLIGVVAVPFALIGLLAHEHAYVQAGQSVPLA